MPEHDFFFLKFHWKNTRGKKKEKERRSEAFSVRHAPYGRGAVCTELRAVGSVRKREKSSRREEKKPTKNTETQKRNVSTSNNTYAHFYLTTIRWKECTQIQKHTQTAPWNQIREFTACQYLQGFIRRDWVASKRSWVGGGYTAPVDRMTPHTSTICVCVWVCIYHLIRLKEPVKMGWVRRQRNQSEVCKVSRCTGKANISVRRERIWLNAEKSATN